MNDLLAGYYGKVVLVTGAAGYLGSALAAALAQVNCRLILCSRSLPASSFMVNNRAEVRWMAHDLREESPWGEELEGVEVIFHLAAHEHRRGSSFQPLLDERINARAVLCLLEMLRLHGRTPRLVFASTSNIAGMAERMPVDEDTPDRPLTLFAVHKLTAEKYLQYYARTAEIPSVALRLANLYGFGTYPAVNERAVLNRMVQAAHSGEALRLFNNRGCRRDFLHLDDAVMAFLAAGVRTLPADGRPYVLGSGEGLTLEETVTAIAACAERLTGKRPQIIQDADAALEAAEMRNFVADSRRFQNAADWRPQVPFKDGIQRMMEALL